MTGCEGQDWASYQDWTPSTAGLAFVCVKATESTGYVNPRYASQVAAARRGGLVVGHYHFARPGSMTVQADYFLRHLDLRPGDWLCLDWEDAGVTSADKDAWIKYVQSKAPAHRVVLYCNRDFWLNRDASAFAGDGLWIADPSAPKGSPAIKSPWLIQQYAETGGMDRDYSHLTAAEFRAWAAGTTPLVEDPMPTAEEIAAAVWNHTEVAKPGTPPVRMGAVLGWMDTVHGNQNAALATAVAQLAALKATVAALVADGGLTAEQITAASEAGADAALAKLGAALTNPPTGA